MKADRVTLGVFDNNPPACRCYRSAGFRDTGTEHRLEMLGETWKILQLELTKEEYFR